MQNKQIFKTIEEALPVLRPGDKLVKKLSNKFAYVQSLYTDGTYSEICIMGLQNGEIITYHNSRDTINAFLTSTPNVEKTMWCFDHSANGKPYHYLVKNFDYRKTKQHLRKLLTLI